MGKGILVIGSLNMDISVDLKDIPAVGETVLGNTLSYRTGGKGANQACAAGMLGGNICMLGCIGQDEFGRKQIESLNQSGVDTSYLKKSSSLSTGTAIIYVDSHGNNNIVVVPGANNECSEEYLKGKEELFDWCDYLMLQMEIPYDSVFYAAKRAKEIGRTVILNPAPAPDALPEELYHMVDYLTPNETELMRLSGMPDCSLDSMKKGAKRLLEKGVGCILVTMGDKGALLIKEDVERLYPAKMIKAIDTTAAGDCFNGAFVTGLSEGMTEEDAVMFANAASAITVTRKGAQESLPARKEIKDYFGEGGYFL